MAKDLIYFAHCVDYKKDTIDPKAACMLAARILLSDGRELCEDCPNQEVVLADPKVQALLADGQEA